MAKALTRGLIAALIAGSTSVMVTTAAADESRVVKSLLEMRSERVILQKWDLSCGAAVLATLITHQIGLPVTERQVALSLIQREEYLRNPELVRLRQGFSLLDMKRFLSGLGYNGTGYGKMTFQDLVEKAPVAIPLDANGYNHFVIFRGVRGNRVLLADPAWGNRTMLIEKFKDMWIDYGDRLGKVGFVIVGPDGKPLPNRMPPRPEDFVGLF